MNIVDDYSGKGDVSYHDNHLSIITINHFLSKFQCGFRQGFNTQHCLLIMIEKLRKTRDEKGFLLLFSLTCQKPSTLSHPNYSSQN